MTKMKRKSYLIGYITVILGAFFYFYEYFFRVSPSVMKAELMSSFHINATLFGTLSGFYFFAYTPMQMVVGFIVDSVSLRKVLPFMVLACAGGTFLLGYTDNFHIALAGRFLQGFGSAFAYVCALKLAARWLPAERFGLFAGLCTGLGFLGGAVGESLLPDLLKVQSWHLAMYDIAGFGILLAILFWIFLTLSNKYKPRLDVHHDRISLKQAFIQFKIIIRNKYIVIAGILSGLMFLPTSVFASLWGVPYLQKLHGYTAEHAGLATSMIFVGWAIGGPIQGFISDAVGGRFRVIAVGAIIASILSCLALYIQSLSFVPLCIIFILFGIFSSAQVLTFAVGRDHCDHRTIGMAVAFINTLAMLGGLVFQREVGRILDANWSGLVGTHGERVYRLIDYQHAMIIIPAGLAIAGIIAIFSREPKLP